MKIARNALTFSALLALAPPPAFADGLMVQDPWSPAAPPGAKVHAAYLVLQNHGDETRTLIGVQAEGYRAASLHESRMTDGVMTMVAVEQIEVAPHGALELRPGGLHIMLMGPTEARSEGDAVPIALEFANGEALKTQAIVQRNKTHASHGHAGHAM